MLNVRIRLLAPSELPLWRGTLVAQNDLATLTGNPVPQLRATVTWAHTPSAVIPLAPALFGDASGFPLCGL